MDKELLEKTANELVSPGRGILAADESNGTMSKRLEAVGIDPSEEERRKYRREKGRRKREKRGRRERKGEDKREKVR